MRFIQRHKTFIILLFVILSGNKQADSQNLYDFENKTFLERLNSDSSYLKLKKKVVKEYVHAQPGLWGEFVNGV